MSSLYFFFVAEARASSSAPKTMSRGTFFSRASTSASITSSRLPVAVVVVAAIFASHRGHQLGPLHVVYVQSHVVAIDLDGCDPFAQPLQHSAEAAAPRLV